MGAETGAVEEALAVRRPLVLGFVVLALLGCGLFGWGAVASISGAVIATGQVEVETRDQVVEHIDGGTVEEILVREGDRVEAGQALVRFDDSLLRTDEAPLHAEHVELVARRNRLEAEFRDAQRIAWDPELVGVAAREAPVREILDGQQRLFDARRAARAGRKAQLRERIGQARRQIAGLRAQAVAVERETGFVARGLEARRTLFAKGMVPLDRLLELEREAARLEGRAGDIEARIAGTRGRIAEIEIQIQQIDTQRLEEAQSRAREVHVRETQVRERLAQVRRRLGRLEVRAPVSGEVFAMAVFARREVVQPGEPMLRIVPEDADLVVVARLDPIHVDQVWRGRDAVLRFTAFPARATPEFEGRIRRVSADAVHDDRSGHSWYEVEVEIGRAIEPRPGTDVAGWVASLPEAVAGWLRGLAPAAIAAGGGVDPDVASEAVPPVPAPPSTRFRSTSQPRGVHDLALVPGMPVEVHVRTGERSPLGYVAKPLTDFFLRALREE